MKPPDLQLNIHEIPDAGVSVEIDLPVEWLAEALLPAYEARGPAHLKAEVTRMGDNALVRGTVRVPVAFQCSRTLERAEVDLDVPFAELFVRSEGHDDIDLSDVDVSSDELVDEPYLIKGGTVDIEDLVRENIVLVQDPYPLHPSQPPRTPDVDDASDADDADGEPAAPLWSSAPDRIDPRWEQLRDIKLKG
jgi:uncharacterized metal-binding protein YceD (DUF177 family)